MLHFDELTEKLADWFMDFFLDPLYVLETTSGKIEVVSMNNQVFEPVMTINDKDMTISSDTGYAGISLTEKLSVIVTASIEKAETLSGVIVQSYNNIFTKPVLFNGVIPYVNFYSGYTKWLTG